MVGVIVYSAGDGPTHEADDHAFVGYQQGQQEGGVARKGDIGVPQMETRKSGRRPNLSTLKAALMVTITSRIVLPVLIYTSC